jgi:preprotein translocase subunit YajC
MKKLLVTLLLLIGGFSFAQTKPKTKDIDKNANVLLDSLSRVYKVKILSILVETDNGVQTTSIAYGKNRELVYKVIKVEKVVKKD